MRNQLFSPLDCRKTEEKMWTKFFALFLLFVVVASDTSTETKCRDGQSYDDGCNRVSCHGGHIVSTAKACGHEDPVTGEFIFAESLPAPEGFWED